MIYNTRVSVLGNRFISRTMRTENLRYNRGREIVARCNFEKVNIKGVFSLVIFPIMRSCTECSGERGLGPNGTPWGPLRPGPCRPPWALVGQAFAGPPGPLWACPWWASWASVGWALVGPPGPLWARPLCPWALVDPPGLLWAPWALAGQAFVGPPGPS